MKKLKMFLFIILALFISIPFVYAKEDIYIESYELIDSSSDSVEKNDPTIDGLNINFDLAFSKVGEYAKYKVVINNTTKDEYKLNNDEEFSSSKYLNYKYEFDKDINKIAANSKTNVYVTITYSDIVELKDYKDGYYIENNNLSLAMPLVNVNNSDKDIKNPNTSSLKISLFIGVLIVLGIVIIVLTKKYKDKSFVISLLLLLSIPFIVKALDSIKLNVTTKVTIKEERHIIESRFVEDVYTNRDFWEYAEDIKTITFENKIREINNYEFKYDVSEDKDNSVVAYLVKNSSNSTKYDLYLMADGYIYGNPDSRSFFASFYSLTDFYHMENFKTITITNMRGMFGSCDSLTTLDLSSFDTSNVTNMDLMFLSDGGLTSLDLSNFDTSNVISMEGMFTLCDNLTSLNVSSFDTSKVGTMEAMFADMFEIKELDLSSFTVNSSTNIEGLFDQSTKLEKIYVSTDWITPRIDSTPKIFNGFDDIPEIIVK